MRSMMYCLFLVGVFLCVQCTVIVDLTPIDFTSTRLETSRRIYGLDLRTAGRSARPYIYRDFIVECRGIGFQGRNLVFLQRKPLHHHSSLDKDGQD
jgi:hypothetical protein